MHLPIHRWRYTQQHNRGPNNEGVTPGDDWSMEVDLRIDEKEKRTLHWFVRGKQQRRFIKGVPDRVEFVRLEELFEPTV